MARAPGLNMVVCKDLHMYVFRPPRVCIAEVLVLKQGLGLQLINYGEPFWVVLGHYMLDKHNKIKVEINTRI